MLESGLFQYYESFDSTRDKPLGLVPLHGATIRAPKKERGKRPSLLGASSSAAKVGPAWRLDTAATATDGFHHKYILAGDDAPTSEAWKEAMQAHIDYAGMTGRPLE